MKREVLIPKTDLTQIQQITASLKNNNQRIVLVSGCFDLLHYGHLDLFYKAKAKGDALIVLVSVDKDIQAIKGKNRPIQREWERAQLVNGFKPVDYVILHSGEIFIELLEVIYPYKIVKGSDHKKHKEHIKQISKYTEAGVDFINRLGSSTKIIDKCKTIN